MNQPKISIIVPVHNAGEHLEKCLTSLICQTLTDIEIILVLDCPTDGSDKVAEAFAAKDTRITIIRNEENLHTGLSRNRGIEMATGKYIGFIDHDDYCDSSMYELLYNKAEKDQLDVARCNFACIYQEEKNSREERYIYPDTISKISDKESVYEYVCGDKVSCVIWNHIYRADFLKENNISFLDSRKICSEDSIFFMEVYDKMNAFGTISPYLYYHVFHNSNTGKMYGYRSIENRISFFEGLYSFLRKMNIDEEKCQSYLSENILKSLYTGSRQALLNLPFGKAIDEIKLIRKSELIMKSINNVYKKENRPVLRKQKPTVIAFFLLFKLLF